MKVCEEIEILPNDPEMMKDAAEASWLCKIFQESNLNALEKQQVLRNIMQNHKQKERQNEKRR